MSGDAWTVGSFHWLRIYGESLVAKDVVAKIIALNDSDPMTYRVKTLDLSSGGMSEIKACYSHNFLGQIKPGEVIKMIGSIKQELEKFVEQ